MTTPAASTGGADGFSCPKCGLVQSLENDACHRCGLDFSRAGKLGDNALWDPLRGNPYGPTLRARWSVVSADLDDADGHRDFIRDCAEFGALNFAGACYRILGDDAPDDERIERYRSQVIKAALAHSGHLDRRVKEEFKTRTSSLLVLCFGALILLGFAIGYYLISRSQTVWQFNG